MPAQENKKKQNLTFGDFEIDAQRQVLLRSGEPITLRPKSYQVLLHLVNHPQQLITKQELMDAVWGDLIVTDDSLTQCLTEIRKAMGDDTKAMIRTVPRRGLIFELPVTTVSHDRKNSDHKTPFPWARIGLVAGSIFAILALAFVFISPDKGTGSVPNSVTVSVLNFQSDSQELRLGARLLAESLRLRLDEIQGLRSRSLDTERGIDSTELLNRAKGRDINWLVTGDIDTVVGAANDKVTLQLWDVDREAVHSLGVFSIPVGADTQSTREFIVQRDLIIERALSRLPRQLTSDPQSGGFPERLSDFEIYAESMAELEREQCNPSLAPTMQPVVNRTPDFSRAWMVIAWAHWVDSWACGFGEESLHKAMAAADRVMELVPNYPQAIKVKTSALAAMGEIDGALEVANKATGESPERAPNWSTLSYLLNYAGELERSRQAMDFALELDPLVLVAETGETPNIYLYVNDWNRFLQTQPPFDAPYFNFQRAYALYRSGDSGKALQILTDTINAAPSDLYSRFCATLKAIIENKPDAAVDILQGIIQERNQTQQTDGEVAYREAVLFRLAGADELAIQRLWISSQNSFICPVCVHTDPAWKPLLDAGQLDEWFASTNPQYATQPKRIGN